MEYNDWANKEYVLHFSQKQIDLPPALRLLSHIVNAHHVWNSRIENSKPKHGVWDVHTLQAILEIQKDNFDRSLDILKTKRVETPVTYRNTKGDEFTSQIWEIFTHVNYHCAYHRGQIATLLRQNNIDPPVTDYIHYRRSVA